MERDGLTRGERVLVWSYVTRFRACSPYLDAEELYCEGRAGLLSARHAWNPARHPPYPQFAVFEVRNAIAAAIRRASPTPKHYAEHAKAQRRAQALLEQHGHPATDENVAAVMGLPVETYRDRQRSVAPPGTVPLEDVSDVPAQPAVDGPDIEAALCLLSRSHPRLHRVVQDTLVRQLNYRVLTRRYHANPRQISAWKRQGLTLLRGYLEDADADVHSGVAPVVVPRDGGDLDGGNAGGVHGGHDARVTRRRRAAHQ